MRRVKPITGEELLRYGRNFNLRNLDREAIYGIKVLIDRCLVTELLHVYKELGLAYRYIAVHSKKRSFLPIMLLMETDSGITKVIQQRLAGRDFGLFPIQSKF